MGIVSHSPLKDMAQEGGMGCPSHDRCGIRGKDQKEVRRYREWFSRTGNRLQMRSNTESHHAEHVPLPSTRVRSEPQPPPKVILCLYWPTRPTPHHQICHEYQCHCPSFSNGLCWCLREQTLQCYTPNVEPPRIVNNLQHFFRRILVVFARSWL